MFFSNLDSRDRVYVGDAAKHEPNHDACAYLAFNSREEHHGILLCDEEEALRRLRHEFSRSMNILVRKLPPTLEIAVCEADRYGRYGFEADAFHRISNETLRVGIELTKEMEAIRAALYKSTQKSRKRLTR